MTAIREPLVRRPEERILLGVCAAVGNHLGISPWYVRAFVLVVPMLIPIYLFLAVAVPSAQQGAVVQSRLARIQTSISGTWLRTLEIPLLILGLALGVAIVGATYYEPRSGILSAFLLLAFGLAIVWSKPAAATVRIALLRIAVGVTAVAVGLTALLMWFFGEPYYGSSFSAVIFVLPILALAVGPAIYRLLNELTEERLQREREAQRADIAAHLHDSVLQTLGVIRSRADDPAEVSRLARAQERELRRWHYEDRPAAGESLADEIELATGRIEDTHGGVIEVVCAGDARPGAWSEPLVAALGEACANAIKHGGGEASVYAEISAHRVEAWVRDRGAGFDLDGVASDRVGVRESILNRMARAGGGAEVRSPLPESGTEVYLWLNNPRSA